MRVLITGGTSLLGVAVAAGLDRRGDDVTLFQRHASGSAFAERLGDLRDREAVSRAVAEHDAVVHLAAKVSVVGPWDDFVDVNVTGTRHVLDAAAAHGITRLVHVSSPSVAHGGDSLVGAGAGAADPDAARGHYARSKAMAERLVLDTSPRQVPVVVVRPHLVWGPGDRQLIGRLVERARAGRLALIGAGSALIDTTYVDNAATALIAALDRCHDLDREVFVVSNGEPRTVKELFTRITDAAGVAPPRLRVPVGVASAAGAALDAAWRWSRRPGEPPFTRFVVEQLSTAHWFDQRRTRHALGWEPMVDLDEGFRRLADWFAAAPQPRTH